MSSNSKGPDINLLGPAEASGKVQSLSLLTLFS